MATMSLVVCLYLCLVLLQVAGSSAGALSTSRLALPRRGSAAPSRRPRDRLGAIRDVSRRIDAARRPSRGQHVALSVAPQHLGEFVPLDAGRGQSRRRRRMWLYDFVSTSTAHRRPAKVPYHEAWDLQKRLVGHQLSRICARPTDPPQYDQFVPPGAECRNGDGEGRNAPLFLGCDSIIMVQHDPVYTLGTASDASFIRGYNENDTRADNVPIVRIERGGEVTYHGPGQLTVYPILDLRGYTQDIHWYMRALEEVVLLALDRAGVKGATREENLTGVWVSGKKIAAFGIKAQRWVTMHGLAVNVDARALRNFAGIVPCGLEGRAVTCVNDEVGGEASRLSVEEFAVYVKDALEEVFGVTLLAAPRGLDLRISN